MKTFFQQFGHGQTERANTSDLARLNTDVTRLLQKHETPGNPNVNGEGSGTAGIGSGITVRATLTATLSYGSSATATRADTGTTITVYDWLLSTGQSIASGKKIVAFWDESAQNWYNSGAQCS